MIQTSGSQLLCVWKYFFFKPHKCDVCFSFQMYPKQELNRCSFLQQSWSISTSWQTAPASDLQEWDVCCPVSRYRHRFLYLMPWLLAFFLACSWCEGSGYAGPEWAPFTAAVAVLLAAKENLSTTLRKRFYTNALQLTQHWKGIYFNLSNVQHTVSL